MIANVVVDLGLTGGEQSIQGLRADHIIAVVVFLNSYQSTS